MADFKSAQPSPLCGMLFETWVVSEVIKSCWHRGLDANIFFLRTRDGDEIDLIFESGGKIFPAEIKLSASPGTDALDAVKKIKKLEIGKKRIICTTQQNMPIASDTELISAWSIA